MSESVPQGENAYRKDHSIVNCPDLIEPLFPHNHFSLTGILSTRKLDIVNGVSGKATNQYRTKTFYGINSIVNILISQRRK